MRKRTKLKAKSCALCKPHKMKWMNRWSKKDESRLREFEKIKKELEG